MEKMWNFIKKTPQTLANSKIMRTFAPVFEKHLLNTTKDGPFVYRLGRKIFILERGVRFSHGLHNKQNHEQYLKISRDGKSQIIY